MKKKCRVPIIRVGCINMSHPGKEDDRTVFLHVVNLLRATQKLRGK